MVNVLDILGGQVHSGATYREEELESRHLLRWRNLNSETTDLRMLGRYIEQPGCLRVRSRRL